MSAPRTSEDVAFLRRVMAGEVYTGMSGEALARWAVGLTEKPVDRPYDRGDLARCMNVYWSAPEGLQPKMRDQIKRWARQLELSPVDFTVRRYYRRGDDLTTYWADREEIPREAFMRCPRCGKASSEPNRRPRERAWTTDLCTPCELAMDAWTEEEDS